MARKNFMITEHFSYNEMTRSAWAETRRVDNTPDELQLAALENLCRTVLEPLRRQFGPITINSAFRSPRVNEGVHGMGNSRHLYGEAADIRFPDLETGRAYFRFLKRLPDIDQLLFDLAVNNFYGHLPTTHGRVYAQIVNPDSPVLMGQMWSSGADQYDATYGTKTGYAVPEVGIPYAVEGVAVVNTTKNLEEALRFVEWFGSAQIQGEWSEQFKTMPANEKAVDMAPASQVAMCSIPAQDIDWAVVAANIDAWCEKIMLEYMQ